MGSREQTIAHMQSDDCQRYYFHYRQGDRVFSDTEGQLCLSLEQAKTKAIHAARDLMAADVRSGLLDLEQEIVVVAAGEVVATLPFRDALRAPPNNGELRSTGQQRAPTLVWHNVGFPAAST